MAKKPAARKAKATAKAKQKTKKEEAEKEETKEQKPEETTELMALEDAKAKAEVEKPQETPLEQPVEETTPKVKAKCKPKAKGAAAKEKPKAKAKSKGKATPKVKGKFGSKKRGKKGGGLKNTQEETGTKTKGAKQSMKDKTSSWRKPLLLKEKLEVAEENPEEEEKEADPEISPDELRNGGKARKFAKMLSKGQLPQEIKEMYQQAAQRSDTPRLFRTEMINRLFQRNQKNEWVMVTKSPEFQSWKESQDKKFSTSKSVGLAPMVMLWQTFHGNKPAMAEAARVGDVFEDGGLWYFKQVETGRTKELTDKMQLSGGASKLSVDEFSDMSGWLTSRPWSKYGQHLPELGNSICKLAGCTNRQILNSFGLTCLLGLLAPSRITGLRVIASHAASLIPPIGSLFFVHQLFSAFSEAQALPLPGPWPSSCLHWKIHLLLPGHCQLLWKL